MEKFLKSLTRDKHSLVLCVLLSIFIIFDVKVPLVLAELVDNPIGKILVAVAALSLLSMNKLVGVVGLVASYVLIQRSSTVTGSVGVKNYLPTEAKKSGHLSAVNQFPVTVEEEIISKMLPMTNNIDLSSPEFKPVLDKNHSAESV
jgi:uncharacterized membrane protein